MAEGDRPGTLMCLRRSVSVALQHTAPLGATELRALAATAAGEPARLGLELVLASGRPDEVFAWSELRRARALWRPSVVPPSDPELALLLEELRHTVSSVELAAVGGDDITELEAKRAELEVRARDRSLRVIGHTCDPGEELPSLERLQERLQGRVFVELFELGGHAYAVCCDSGSAFVCGLGPTTRLMREAALLRFALQRLVVGRDSPASLSAAAELLFRARGRADDLVFGPLRGLIGGDGEIAIVPTGSLHVMPWGLLPSLSARPVSVVPSAAILLRSLSAGPRRHAGAGTVLVAGPGVPGAGEEVARVAARHSGPIRLEGAEATVPAVMSSAPRTAVLHIAAHGHFRADNPQFSSVRLADGPLTVYDLELMGDPPELLVLSACDVGRTQVGAGDALMGATAAMLSAGAKSIVASVVPVADSVAPEVMAGFHSGVAAGMPIDESLAAVRREHRLPSSPEVLASRSSAVLAALASSSFVCFGSGEPVRDSRSRALATSTPRSARTL